MNRIHVDTCTSTLSYAAGLSEEDTPHGTVVTAREQTAGRGQRGNSWESEPGANLTFSLVLRPHKWPATRQFELSMAVAVGVCRALRRSLPDADVRVKWPNDIYWRAQRTDQLNEKRHYIDASELVPTVSEFMDLPFLDGKSLTDLFPDAVFYASVKE